MTIKSIHETNFLWTKTKEKIIFRIVDSVQESCHCNDSLVCITSVQCIDGMLGALERISHGTAISDSVCDAVQKYYKYIQDGG